MYDKLQPSFSAGAIHPDFWHRTDLAAVQFGVKESTNTIFTNTGAWMMRPGTKYLNDALDANNSESVLIPLYVSDSERYVLEFSDLAIRVLGENGKPITVNDLNYPIWISGTTYEKYAIVRAGSKVTVSWTLIESVYAHLYFYTGYDCNILPSEIIVSTNTTDTLSVSMIDSKLAVLLADTTAAKNTAALIQVEVRDLGTQNGWDFSQFVITANDNYDGDPTFLITPTNTIENQGCFFIADDLLNPDRNNPLDTGDDFIFPTEYLEAELSDIRFVQNGYDIYLAHGNHQPMVFQYFNITAPSFLLKLYNFINKPMIAVGTQVDVRLDDFSVFSIETTYQSELSVKDKWGYSLVGDSLVGTKIKTINTIPTQEITEPVTNQSTWTSSEYYCGGLIDVTIADLPGGVFVFAHKSTDGSIWTEFDILIGTSSHSVDFGEQCMLRFSIDNGSPVSFTLSAIVPTHISEGIFLITDNNDDGTFDVETVKPSDLDLGADYPTYYIDQIGDFFGWPSGIYTFESRLGFFGLDRFPLTRFESKTDDFFDFGTSVPLIASDAMNVSINSGYSKIQNIIDHEGLVILTGQSEIKIFSDQSGYGPLNIPIRKKMSENGSSSVTPVMLNKSLVYLSYGNDRLRVADSYYTQVSAIEVDEDITRFSHHLFDGYTITRLAYSRTPFPIIWAVRSDGKLLSCTFDRNAGIIAWSDHDFGAGALVENIMVLRTSSDVLYLVINRDGSRHIESLSFDIFTTINDAYRVDSGLILTANPASTTFDSSDYPDLAHLNTEVVSILADGWAMTKTVQASTLTFAVAVSKVVVGHPYTAIFHPLRPIVDTKTGTGLAKPEKINFINVRFKNTVGGEVGSSSADLSAVPGRKSDPTIPEPLYTGWSDFRLNTPYMDNDDYDSSLFYFKQTSPYPATILALIPDVDRS